MIKFFLLFLITGCWLRQANAQHKYSSTDFRRVDSLAITVKYENDIYKLAKDLAANYSEDVYKVRSIFRWVADNIRYDYKFINKGKQVMMPDCEGSINCEQTIKDWEDGFVKSILKKKKAICSGYAYLFQKLCKINGIECEIISGYVKYRPYHIGNNLVVDHAWNAVMLDGIWYYLDATWAAGYVEEDEEKDKLLAFVKNFKNYYWFTPFNRLVRNHYPENGKWVETQNFTKEKFFDQPHYYGLGILEKISNEILPGTGMIEVKKGASIHFKFDYLDEISKIQINSNVSKNPPLWSVEEGKRGKKLIRKDTAAIRKQVYIPFKKTGNTYEFDYPVTDQSLYYLELFIDQKQAMRYKVKVEE